MKILVTENNFIVKANLK